MIENHKIKTFLVSLITISLIIQISNFWVFASNEEEKILGNSEVLGISITLNNDETLGVNNSKRGVIKISNIDELNDFSSRINKGELIDAELTDDIIVNQGIITKESSDAVRFVPIGSKDNPFEGYFNGKGHKISGLYFNDENESFVGLFGFVGEEGKIENIKIDNSYFRGSACIGSVCGVNSGTIINCENEGEISGKECIGGNVGLNIKEGRVKNCKNTGKIEGIAEVGGNIGENFGEVICCENKGNIFGREYIFSEEDKVERNIINYEEVENSNGNLEIIKNEFISQVKGCYIGGNVGFNFGNIKECKNKGEIISDVSYNREDEDDSSLSELEKEIFEDIETQEDDKDEQQEIKMAGIGGNVGYNVGELISCKNKSNVIGNEIVGGNVGDNNNGNVENCDNTGNIIGKIMWVGGNIGCSCGKVSDCSNKGMISGDIKVGGNIGTSGNVFGIYDPIVKNCKNFGQVEGNERIGGNFGQIGGGDATDCENEGDIIGKTLIGGNAGTNFGNISNFKNFGKVTGDEITGGNIGINNNKGKIGHFKNEGEIIGKNGYIGGNIGLNVGAVIDLINNGKISGDQRVGGNVGQNAKQGNIQKCQNQNNVIGRATGIGGNIGSNQGFLNDCKNSGNIMGKEEVGGNVGWNALTGQDKIGGRICNCGNQGIVVGIKRVGGNIGQNARGGRIDNCKNEGEVRGSLDIIGGNIGLNSGTVNICFNQGIVRGDKKVRGNIGLNVKGGIFGNCKNKGRVLCNKIEKKNSEL